MSELIGKEELDSLIQVAMRSMVREIVELARRRLAKRLRETCICDDHNSDHCPYDEAARIVEED